MSIDSVFLLPPLAVPALEVLPDPRADPRVPLAPLPLARLALEGVNPAVFEVEGTGILGFLPLLLAEIEGASTSGSSSLSTSFDRSMAGLALRA